MKRKSKGTFQANHCTLFVNTTSIQYISYRTVSVTLEIYFYRFKTSIHVLQLVHTYVEHCKLTRRKNKVSLSFIDFLFCIVLLICWDTPLLCLFCNRSPMLSVTIIKNTVIHKINNLRIITHCAYKAERYCKKLANMCFVNFRNAPIELFLLCSKNKQYISVSRSGRQK